MYVIHVCTCFVSMTRVVTIILKCIDSKLKVCTWNFVQLKLQLSFMPNADHMAGSGFLGATRNLLKIWILS